MTDKEIAKLLESYVKNGTSFNKYSVLQLCKIMQYLESNLKTKKGNWSTSLFDSRKIKIYTLEYFYKQYSKRKKETKTLKTYIETLKTRESNELLHSRF